MLYKDEVLELLDQWGVEYELLEHKAVFTIDEVLELDLPQEDSAAKNLFIRNDKKKNYYLVTINGEKKADFKKLREHLNERPLKFASETDLKAIMGLPKGSVTPFGILNDEECRVRVLMDSVYKGETIGIHPNDNTATVWLKMDDLEKIIKNHGNEFEYIEI